jgi:hypothetical protein
MWKMMLIDYGVTISAQDTHWGEIKLTVGVTELLNSHWLLISHQVATGAPLGKSGIMFVVNPFD